MAMAIDLVFSENMNITINLNPALVIVKIPIANLAQQKVVLIHKISLLKMKLNN